MGAPLKIVWLCTFSNAEKRSHLKLWRRSCGEIGQWIPNLLKGFAGDERYELHVISPEGWMKQTIEGWLSDGVTYHCFQVGIPGIGYSFRLPVEEFTHYYFSRRAIHRLLEEIQPDLIHLFGVENPQYGAAVLDLDGHIPVLVTIQGFIHREQAYHDDYQTRVRCKYEKALLTKCRCYTGDYDAENVVRSLNPAVSWAHIYFPVNEDLIAAVSQEELKFDVLFAGALTKAKGFADFLELVRLLKAARPQIKAAVVGYADVYAEAVPYIEKHGLQENVVWLGRFPSQEGLFQAYRQAKLFIAPTYNDCFASTLRENMLLGTPCVAYRTGGIPFANRDGAENIVLVDQGDVRGLFESVLRLLKSDAERAEVSARALAFAQREFSLKANVDVIRKEYERVMRL